MRSPPPRVVVPGAGVAGLEVVSPLELQAPGDADGLPLEDTFLALLEADAAADRIAAVVGGRPVKRPFSSHLLSQFAAAEPFDAGPGRRFLDLGVHAMAGMPL